MVLINDLSKTGLSHCGGGEGCVQVEEILCSILSFSHYFIGMSKNYIQCIIVKVPLLSFLTHIAPVKLLGNPLVAMVRLVPQPILCADEGQLGKYDTGLPKLNLGG